MEYSRGIYLTHVDRDLGLPGVNRVPIEHDELRALLVLYSLLYERLIIPDGASFYNLTLRDILQGAEYRHLGLAKLFEQGIVVPVARDVAPTFVELEAFLYAAGAWRSPDRNDGRRWAEFLDEHTSARVLLHHPSASETFSELVYEVTRDHDAAGRLMLGGVRDDLSRFIAAREVGYEDGFTRRSTLYEFADRLPGSEAISARQTRILGGALYHLTAANALGLQCAMAGPFASAFAELSGLAANVQEAAMADGSSRSEQAAHAVPFDPIALAEVDFEVISDIRRSREFRVFIDTMSAAKADRDPVRGAATARDALTRYLGYLDGPLTIAVSGRSRDVRRLKRAATATSLTFMTGGVATSVVGLVVPGAGVLTFLGGFFWLFGEKSLGGYLKGRLSATTAEARADAAVARLRDSGPYGIPSLSRPQTPDGSS